MTGGLIRRTAVLTGSLSLMLASISATAQVPPTEAELSGYTGLHAAAAMDDVAAIRHLSTQGADVAVRDAAGRTPVHVAAFKSHDAALRALVEAGVDINALEGQAYDVITIAAVANDIELVKLALTLGGDPGAVTSPYEGTALIAAAHLGHYEIVALLIAAAAPLDHVNNLGWTALMEAVVLGDGGPRHIATARALIEAGADASIGDRQGITPREHAAARGYEEMLRLFPEMEK